jgi:membrane associated rhomboid family serine protease
MDLTQTSLGHLSNFQFHTLVTASFSQQDTNHLIGNMMGLYFFGRYESSAFLFALLTNRNNIEQRINI